MVGVIVFVCGVSLVNGLENLALGGLAYQTDTYAPADRAIDGDPNQSWYGNSCTHTLTDTGAWWEVDLGDLYYIGNVKVYNRMDCCSIRLSDVQLYIGYSRSVSNYVLQGYHAGAIGSTYTFEINPAVYGRWVRITRVGNHEELTLCEVEVFGQKATRKMLFQMASNQNGTDNVIGSTTVSSAVHCSTMCLTRSDCAGVNYHSANDTCDFLRSTTTVTAENYNTGYIIYP